MAGGKPPWHAARAAGLAAVFPFVSFYFLDTRRFNFTNPN